MLSVAARATYRVRRLTKPKPISPVASRLSDIGSGAGPVDTLAWGCEPKLCAQAATGLGTFSRLRLAATGGLEASAAQ